MKFCKRCGGPVEPEDVFCGECGMRLIRETEDEKGRAGAGFAAPEGTGWEAASPEAAAGAGEAEAPAEPDFELSGDEREVRRYRCCVTEFPNQRGVLTVTTRRVVFSSVGDKTRVIRELPLDAAAGVQVLNGSCISWGRASGGFALVAAGLSLLFTGRATASIALLFLAGVIPGAILMYTALRPRFSLEIGARWGSPLRVGVDDRDLLLHDDVDTEKLARELGALLCSLQGNNGENPDGGDFSQGE